MLSLPVFVWFPHRQWKDFAGRELVWRDSLLPAEGQQTRTITGHPAFYAGQANYLSNLHSN